MRNRCLHLPYDADWLVLSVCHLCLVIDLDRLQHSPENLCQSPRGSCAHLAHNLISPSSIIPETSDAVADVEVPSDFDWLSVVQALELRQFLCIPLHQISELVYEAGSVDSSNILAPSGLEGFASCLNRYINILGGSSGNGAQLLFGGRVVKTI